MNTPAFTTYRVRPFGRMAGIIVCPFLFIAQIMLGQPSAPPPPDWAQLPDIGASPAVSIGNPDIISTLNHSKGGVGPIQFEAYRYRGWRLPVWYVVHVTTGASSTNPKSIDLYDIGVQGRINRVVVRIRSGNAILKVTNNGADTTPQPVKGFYLVPPCGGTPGSPGPCKAVLECSDADCVLECAYARFCGFKAAAHLLQPDDGSPPPSRPGQPH